MSLTLRYMTLDDIPQVVEIDRQAFSTPWTARSYAYEVSESGHSYMVVLEEESEALPTPIANGLQRWWQRVTRTSASTPAPQRRLIAYGGLWNITDEAHISTIAVLPEFRGHGYGEIVLAAMIQRALNLNAGYVVLEVRVSNTVAQNLYLKHGFEQVAVKRKYYRDDGEDAYDMRLKLTDKVRADYPARFAALMTAKNVTNQYAYTLHPRDVVHKADPMRILFVTTYYAPDGGATATLLTRLAKTLVERGHEVTVLAAMPHYPQRRIRDGYRGRFTMRETLDGVQVVRAWLWTTPSPRMSRRLISQISLMFTLLIRGLFMPRADVLLIEGQPVFTGFAGQMLAFLKRRPYVLDVSDLWPDHLLTVGALTETHPVYRVARALVNGTFRGASHIVALSPLWKSKIDEYIEQPQKTHTIYCGTDLTRFSPQVSGDAFRAQHGLTGVKVVSFIGAFTTQNDFDALFEAARLLRHREDIVFAFIGGGSLDHKRADAADLPNVRWLGWVEADDMPQAWAASDITLLSLRDHPLYEGIAPAKYFEAMACGVPIVAAARGIPAQMLTDSGAGLAVPNGDAAGVAESITRLLDDARFYTRCARAGRAYAEAHFDPQRVTDGYEALLRDAARL